MLTLQQRGIRCGAVVARFSVAGGAVLAGVLKTAADTHPTECNIAARRGQGHGLTGDCTGKVTPSRVESIPEHEAKRHEGRLAKGGILLSVHCDTSDEIKRAKNIMKGMGAEDISSAGESSSSSSEVPPVGRAAGTR